MLIKVPESEFRALIDREKVVSDIKEHLSPWTASIRDMTNYGSNLIPRCFISSDRSLKDVVVLAILLRQALAMLDGVEILLCSGAVHIAHLQMRALFEVSVYIDWILLSDSETKATYYYVHNLRRKRALAQRVQPGSVEAQEFTTMMNEAGVPINHELRDTAKGQLKEIDRVLSQPKFATISSEIEKYRNGKRFDPAWYVPLGERTLRAMARTVGKTAQYVFVYSGASEVMHTSSYEHHVNFAPGQVTFQPIRSVEGFGNVFRFSTIIALSTFKRILEEYRPGEVTAFRRKYTENWQEEFSNFPKITVKVETTRI
jgi:hypothetical protein